MFTFYKILVHSVVVHMTPYTLFIKSEACTILSLDTLFKSPVKFVFILMSKRMHAHLRWMKCTLYINSHKYMGFIIFFTQAELIQKIIH
jgi:hypothetical protein